jgi:hypothetical protein
VHHQARRVRLQPVDLAQQGRALGGVKGGGAMTRGGAGWGRRGVAAAAETSLSPLENSACSEFLGTIRNNVEFFDTVLTSSRRELAVRPAMRGAQTHPHPHNNTIAIATVENQQQHHQVEQYPPLHLKSNSSQHECCDTSDPSVPERASSHAV